MSVNNQTPFSAVQPTQVELGPSHKRLSDPTFPTVRHSLESSGDAFAVQKHTNDPRKLSHSVKLETELENQTEGKEIIEELSHTKNPHGFKAVVKKHYKFFQKNKARVIGHIALGLGVMAGGLAIGGGLVAAAVAVTGSTYGAGIFIGVPLAILGVVVACAGVYAGGKIIAEGFKDKAHARTPVEVLDNLTEKKKPKIEEKRQIPSYYPQAAQVQSEAPLDLIPYTERRDSIAATVEQSTKRRLSEIKSKAKSGDDFQLEGELKELSVYSSMPVKINNNEFDSPARAYYCLLLEEATKKRDYQAFKEVPLEDIYDEFKSIYEDEIDEEVKKSILGKVMRAVVQQNDLEKLLLATMTSKLIQTPMQDPTLAKAGKVLREIRSELEETMLVR